MNRHNGLDLSDIDQSVLQRFWNKVDTAAGIDVCWPWLAHRKKHGYGQFTLRKGVFIGAHRISYALSHGAIPPGSGLHVCHRCDNPPCVNPRHLYLGTAQDNMLDCVTRGRANRSRGTAHLHAKLTPDAVRRIRAAAPYRGLHTDLAREFGVSPHAIYMVRIGRTWVHVDEAAS